MDILPPILPCVACPDDIRSESSFRCHRCKKACHARCGSLRNEECSICEDKWIQRACYDIVMPLLVLGTLMFVLYHAWWLSIEREEAAYMEALRGALRRTEVQAQEAMDVFASACLSQEVEGKQTM